LLASVFYRHRLYTPNPDRLRDWISTPKSNGTNRFTPRDGKEWTVGGVQIRTKRMDEIAEKGYAAHWKYKDTNSSHESNLEKWLVRVRELLEKQDLTL
jgi:Guanosine polyphosphate pyrophosphohydrolases/synthetases